MSGQDDQPLLALWALIRKPVFQEDEGQSCLIGTYPTKQAALDELKRQSASYWTVNDFVVIESSQATDTLAKLDRQQFSPLAEPAAEPSALDVFFGQEPEAFSEADLTALVAAQRSERERRALLKERKKAKTKPETN